MVTSHLPNKAVWAAAGTTGWIFLTALKINMDSALHDAALEHGMQGGLEELEQCILALEQEPRGPEEPSISDSVVVSGVMMNSGRLRMLAMHVVRLRVPT